MNSPLAKPLRIAIVGAGWAGLAAAVQAVQRGHQVTVFEAARTLGGRARGVPLALPDGREVMVDNGQHILIGAYTESLRLMRSVGVDPEQALLRQSLALRFVDGRGLQLPDWPAPLDALAGILGARGWRWTERAALLRAAWSWRRAGFACASELTVAELCRTLPARLVAEFVEPLCVAALNTPVEQASGQVFLRVLRDALLGGRGHSNLLLPRVDLGTLLPHAAVPWLQQHGATVRTGERVDALHWRAPHWQAGGRAFDRVIWATSAPHAVQALAQSAQHAGKDMAPALQHWCDIAATLSHRAITTVYAQARWPAASRRLPAPMLALRSGPQAPAQFVFDRDAITGTHEPTGLLAFVVSDSAGARPALEAGVVAQAHQELGLAVQPLLAVTEKRATFACTAGLQRPPALVAPGLLACGDYVAGPYPATLEGTVRSGRQAAEALR